MTLPEVFFLNKVTVKVKNPDGTVGRKKQELSFLLNLGVAKLLNRAELNKYDLPIHHCDPNVYPEFIALSSETAKFHQSILTALAFYQYDRYFDNFNGLYNAIYYDNSNMLSKFRKQYEGIRFVIAPDYSLFDDMWEPENISRLFKIRVVMLWFVLEIGAIVIPNAVYLHSSKLPLYLSGLENCTVMCFSTKGHVRRAADRRRVQETVKYVVDNFPLKMILVYSVCGRDDTSYKLFKYAISHGVEVKIVDNTLRRRNQALRKKV